MPSFLGHASPCSSVNVLTGPSASALHAALGTQVLGPSLCLYRPPKLSEGNKTKTRQSVSSDPRACLRGLVSGWRCRAAHLHTAAMPSQAHSHACTNALICTQTHLHSVKGVRAHIPPECTYTHRHICTHCTHAYTHADTHTRGHGGLAEGAGEAWLHRAGPSGFRSTPSNRQDPVSHPPAPRQFIPIGRHAFPKHERAQQL